MSEQDETISGQFETRQTRDRLEQFARKHNVVLFDRGTVGFGRACVGFTRDGSYISYVRNYGTRHEFADPRLQPPAAVVDAYLEGSCMVVLARTDIYGDAIGYAVALDQLAVWAEYLDNLGVEIVRYKKIDVTPLQAAVTGWFESCFRVKEDNQK